MSEPLRALVLASTSPYRRDLLARLGLQFEVAAPRVDEAALPGESPADTALRLAVAKARDVAARHPAAWVIGSDQLAELDGAPLGKPGCRGGAIRQLAAMAGRPVVFHTAVCVVRDGMSERVHVDRTVVHLRSLESEEIERYVDAEQPLDCAGSFKAEGRGIALFDAIESRDPTALIGLPLIATAALLREAGFQLP